MRTSWILKGLHYLVCASLLLGIWGFGGTGSTVSSQEGCRLTIREDIYFLPPSELADTKSFPETLVLENETITAWVMPNRGRLIFEMILKETGHSQLLTNPTPLPLRFQGVYTFEFGGVYSTFPWNRRDQQPLNLAFEILNSQGTCEVRMRSQDPETDFQFTGELRLPPMSAELQVILTLTNPTDTAHTISFETVAIIRPGGAITQDTGILLPVETVEVGSSQDGWMGSEGTQVAWPAPWSQWGTFQGAGWFYADLQSFRIPALAVYNPQTDEAVLLRWDANAPWDRVAVFSWGSAYADELGAYPAFRVELQDDALNLPAGGEQTLRFRLSTQRGRPVDGFPGD